MKLTTLSTLVAVLAVTQGQAFAAPSDDFDLSQWKLTLPVSEYAYFGSGDDDDAAEILPSDCTGNNYSGSGIDEGFEDTNYFYSDSSGAMVFVTPLDGGASTLNSSYVRSELRELYDWSACDSTGTANWDISSGTHTLSATLSVTDYYDDDPQTVVGQIHAHNSNYALVKLQWDGPTKDVRAIINESAEDGNNFDLEFGLVPGTDEWSYTIEVEDKKISISVTYGGETVTKSVTIGEGDMDDDWLDDTFYFKAGNYAQANKSSGGSFTVKFTDLDVSHSD
ncbi:MULTISPECIES: polysaccharide lyase family 7 protein [unclassified Vibrio]|uniref:Polysaccharide lyase family 7 protein n=1 Tax=Vibrio sp. HB236076 TaxID=3232307 RepID=A0AB39HBW5_9VIBR|nr:polysaccharide lyase family 7 protein [Vibrio sp. HB161653]MDP5254308.1 polysaccharide lyase family 7 protein [Vibrio sp. HB161653]